MTLLFRQQREGDQILEPPSGRNEILSKTAVNHEEAEGTKAARTAQRLRGRPVGLA
jgi:hypothetical protein